MDLQKRLQNKLDWLKSTKGIKTADAKLTVDELEAIVGLMNVEPDNKQDDEFWPIVNITVSEEGKITEAKLYAPGLPPGNHDVYPVHVPYMDEHTEAWFAVVKALEEAVPNFMCGPGNGIECAVAAIRQLAAGHIGDRS